MGYVDQSSALEGLDAHEEFVVCGDLVLSFEAIVEVDTGEAAVGVNL